MTDTHFSEIPTSSVDSKKQNAISRPKLYKVVMINDDFTPMDFVVLVLKKFFSMNNEKAVEVMITIHNNNKGVCGVYTREIAETKMQQVNSYSRDNKHPLVSQIEQCKNE